MATVHDVASYIVNKQGAMSAMKLQKLCYYAQAWSLVFDDAALFSQKIRAWANGPVVRELFEVHRGKYTVDAWPRGDSSHLSPAQRATIDAVLDAYGGRSGQQLSVMTHRERPWIEARDGLSATERSSKEISLATMADYYGALLDDARS